MSERWYQSVSDDGLEQGDVFLDFPVLVASLSSSDIDTLLGSNPVDFEPEESARVVTNDFVIMTQSCDLENKKVDSVLLCPLWRESDMKGTDKDKEEIRRGNRPGWHLLKDDKDADIPLFFVEFTRIYTSPKTTIQAFARREKERPRLKSPYKEHLSQAFARFFMRVGLPSDIPPFR